MVFPPLQNRLLDHFADERGIQGGQQVYVGTRPVDDGWVVTVLRIDDCTDEAQAIRLGARIQVDLVTHLRFTNQEDVPIEAVAVEHGVPAGASGWSVAAYVTLRSMQEAHEMVGFLTAYANPDFE